MKKIIDLSKYNNIVNFDQLKGNCDGIIIRCGYRGYGSGKIVKDVQCDNNIRGCISYGIPFGVYFMSQALNTDEATDEADFAISCATRFGTPTLGIYIDSEDADGTTAIKRADALNRYQRTKVVIAFCNTVKAHGIEAGVYANEDWYKNKLQYDDLKHFIIWCAKYGKNNGTKSASVNLSKVDIHQYTSKGRIAGVYGYVDISEMTGTTQQPQPNPPQHIQLNYQPNHTYTLQSNMKVRIKPHGEVIGCLKKGTRVTSRATTRLNNEIWSYLGTTKYKGKIVEHWICADNGNKAYML